MNIIDAKEYLMQLKDIDNLINAQMEDIRQQEEMIGCIGSQILDGPPSKTNNTSDKTGTLATDLAELKNEAAMQCQKYVKIKRTAMSIINEIYPMKYRTVLTKYYVQNKTLEQTAYDMGKSYQWTCTIRDRALTEFQRIYEERMKNERQHSVLPQLL